MTAAEQGQKDKRRKRSKLRISVQITAVVLTIFIISSVIGLFVFRKSLDDLAANSKNKVVESVASLVSSAHDFVGRMAVYLILLESGAPDYGQIEQGLQQAVDEGVETPVQQQVNYLLKETVNSGILDLEMCFYAFPPGAGTDGKAIIVASSDSTNISEPVPEKVAALIDSDKNYRLFEDGIPEMGLEGEYLVTSYKLIDEGSNETILWYFDFKPMDELLSGIDSFYSKESRTAMLWLSLVMGLSIICFIVISFLVLGYLVKKRITGPIEELSGAAEKVIDGNMDVRLEIKPREEFSGLKRVFNQMISSISAIVSKTVSEQAGEEQADKPAEEKAFLKPRSTILFQVIALFTIVFIVAGIFSMLSIRSSMNSMVEKSKETLIEAEGELLLSAHDFGGSLGLLLMNAGGVAPIPANSTQQFAEAVPKREISEYQIATGEIFKMMIDGHLFNYAAVYCVLEPTHLNDDYLVVISSDDKFIYTTPPKEIGEFFEQDEDTFKFFPDGIPEMGFNEPFLASCYKNASTSVPGADVIIVDFKPMGEEVKAIDNFYDKESNKITLTMAFVIGLSILVMILITILVLMYLIRKEITGPIDELVVVANQVMDGDLDVQVQLRPGEELESLKIAFNKMIKTLSDLVEESMSD
ncbi:MAG: HAMP domain-containing protein [Actinobacteria bacterium]|nr:HAMP domain-containing protein [Actinomycetota bacterium]